MKKITLDCGCEFPVENDQVVFKPDFNTIKLDCDKTWDVICSGNTKGVFQLESFLGEHYSKEARPRSIEELAALVSLIRPACLQAKMDDGKNLTDHYIMRKHDQEEVKFITPELAAVVGDTYGILTFQEQAIRVGIELAGLTEAEADTHIRYVIGKKKVDRMAKTKAILKDGMEKKGIDPNVSEEIISWIEAGQRYSFNKSHAVEYSYITYMTAYLKAHFPLQFYTKYLKHAKHRLNSQDEIRQLIRSAKKEGIYVFQPNIKLCNKEYAIFDKRIYVGLTDIKHVGNKDYEYIQNNCVCINQATWFEMVVFHLNRLKKNAAEAMIDAGALDTFFDSRKRAKLEFKSIKELTKKEIEFIEPLDPHISIEEAIKKLLDNGYNYGQPGISSKKRIKKVQDIHDSLKNPKESMTYTNDQIENLEVQLVGFPITITPVQNNITADMANTKCIDFAESQLDWRISIAGRITSHRFHTTKDGNEMCFLSLEDETCELSDVIIFNSALKKIKHFIFNGNLVFATGNRSRKNRQSFVINDLKEI